ncbi:MFS transporter [Catenulispora sp. NL8]|uniref:MFS transporter n=1 Tax=Catenulispora pinistramenti TaxID=2705254 RepID=A0ABS5KTZ8_9ACTN|nr:MFS transporter [Catenulispora pinistramenti]MBS2549532.1 MFS transporter [Catenulispora pinistramenti]
MNPLRDKPFQRFFVGQSVSVLGGAATQVALFFAVLQLTGSAKDLSFVVSAQMLPTIALLLIGGGIGDRLGQALLLRVTHFGLGLTQGVMAFCLLTKQPIGYLIGLAFLTGVLSAFAGPSLSGIVPQLVRPEGLRKANSLLASVGNAARVLGPTVGGVLVSTIGGGWALAADSASFFLAAVIFCFVPVSGRVRTDRKLFSELRQGWAYFRGSSWIWSMTAAFTVSNFLQMGAGQVLGLVLAKQTFGAEGWGVILSCRAVGQLIMSVLMIRVKVRRPLLVGQIAITVQAVPYLLLGLNGGVAAVAAASFVAGFGITFAAVSWDTSLHTYVPNDMMSRVVSYDLFGRSLAVPLGQLSVIPIADALGTRHVMVGTGVLFAVAMVAPLTLASVRRVGTEAGPAPPKASTPAPAAAS